jgi:hypothetical protein
MNILPFPKNPPKRGRLKKPEASAPRARVHVFSRTRHVQMMSVIVTRMLDAAKCAREGDPMGAAEAALIEHLEIDCSTLAEFGIADPEMENEIRSFAVAAWAGFMKHFSAARAPGAA